MGNLTTIQWISSSTSLLFMLAFGAIVGSFINVVVYRLPRGEGLVRPPSACPSCGTRLSWRENVPVLGWLLLRGRCRFCRSPISIEYPAIELLVALLFGGAFAMWYMRPSVFELVGLTPAFWTPEWARMGVVASAPMFLLILLMVGSLVAITLIDARTFMIPLSIPWLVTAAGFVVHPAYAAWYSFKRAESPAWNEWVLPLVSGPWLGATLGCTLGIAIAVGLMQLRLLPRSFADYEAWEKEAEATLKQAEDAQGSTPAEEDAPSLRQVLMRTLLLTGPGVAGMFLGFLFGQPIGQPWLGLVLGMTAGLVIGVFLRRTMTGPDSHIEPVWLGYPHARREMLKELVYLSPAIGLGLLGWWITGTALAEPPLWLGALGGSLAGYIVGGGVVWGVRIFASLAFGKEAMGLGDVHLMGAVGAVLGWIDPVLAFFTAPFLGLLWAAGSVISGTMFNRSGTAIPFGPHLAISSVLVVFGKPGFEVLLSTISGRTIDLP
jgi:leader peptidase (prepilin peptidase)/N-methyltransferase